jgi:crotonobetainyl-CoA:carnitine CoA-transferase CaiB-like acyl-CoA transferase
MPPMPSEPANEPPAPPHDQPLAGVRVIELATGVAGAYAGKLLADFGADVVKVEPPGGDPLRWWGPFPGEDPGAAVVGPSGAPEVGGLHLHLNTNKRSIVADLDDGPDRDLLAALVAGADVVIESFPVGRLDAAGLGWEALHARHPALVLTSVTGFGQDGPYAGFRGSEIVAYAMGGPMHATGIAEREPLKLGGHEISYQCGAVAALATLGALAMVDAGGVGCHIDVANFETQAGSIDRRAVFALQHAYNGKVMGRAPRAGAGVLPSGLYPATDGWVQIGTPPRFAERLLATLADPDLDAAFADGDWLTDPDVWGLVEAATYSWLGERTAREAMAEAQPHHWPVTALCTPLETLDDPHLMERRFWTDLAHPDAGVVRHPGPPVRLDGAWALRRSAPRLDEHGAEVRAEAGARVAAAPPEPSSATSRAPGPARLPLEGVVVVDLTVVWAGPYTTMLLGDLGAEVVRVENPAFYNGTRGSSARPAKAQLRALSWLGAYPDDEPGPRPWNRNAFFNCHARNKAGISLDFGRPGGVDAFLRLVERADVVVENNSVDVLDKLGIGWDVLRARNPRLVLVRMPALGLDGPHARYVGFGANFEALYGLTALRGYPDEDPSTTHSVYYMDAASGAAGAVATMLALRRRARTGRGELVEVAQAENMLNLIGEFVIDAGLRRRAHGPMGNRDVALAPQGAYPCRGADRWLVLTVHDDAGWLALREAMGNPPWAAVPRFLTAAGRRAHHREVDEGIGAWTAGLDRWEATARLQAAGIAAGPVLDDADLLADPHLRARGFLRANGSPEVGWYDHPGHLWRWSGPPLRWTELCRFGADNERIWRDLVGLDAEEYAALDAAGHLSMDFFEADGTPL